MAKLVDLYWYNLQSILYTICSQGPFIPGRLYVKRYYHPIKHIMRPLKEFLDAKDLSITPQVNNACQKNFPIYTWHSL